MQNLKEWDERAIKLTTLLEKQIILYQNVLTCSQMQKNKINSNDSAGWLEELNAKQKILDEIDVIDQDARPLLADWDRQATTAAIRDKLENIIRQIQELLETILQVEDEGRAKLVHEKQTISDQLLKVQKGKAMHKAYGASLGQHGRIAHYKDQKG